MTTEPNLPPESPNPASSESPNGAPPARPLSPREITGTTLTPEPLTATGSTVTPRVADYSSATPGTVRSLSPIASSPGVAQRSPNTLEETRSLVLIVAVILMLLGLWINSFWLSSAGSIVALLVALQILWQPVRRLLIDVIPREERAILIGSVFGFVALLGFLQVTGVFRRVGSILANLGWDAIGALGEVLGALGQILIAILAVYIAWRQYVISRDLTIQQNTITQQQTIDAYFQGVSDLVLDEEGLLEDWPQERAIAEGRTAAIFSSVDASGKAKILRFLSRARLLTPLRRDSRLGRAILDGTGGYEEDRDRGVRVIDLGVMLAGADLSGTDLRWTDLSEANLIRADLSRTDLVKTNFARAILCDASLRYADVKGTRFFYGRAQDATPRSRTEPPNYRTGAHTGAVVEDADFTGVQGLSDEQRYYCCAWGGSATRSTIPGGCEGIPNQLGR